jgi:hypothetical protein
MVSSGNVDSALVIRELVKPAVIDINNDGISASSEEMIICEPPTPAPAPEPTSDEVMMAFFGMPSSSWETSVGIGL